MKISSFACASFVALVASLSMTVSAAAADCAQGFWKSNVTGTPPAESSSFVCTTKVITCPASTSIVVIAQMSDQKATDVGSNKVKFTYTCTYPPPIK
jgi:hypothetical protein